MFYASKIQTFFPWFSNCTFFISLYIIYNEMLACPGPIGSVHYVCGPYCQMKASVDRVRWLKQFYPAGLPAPHRSITDPPMYRHNNMAWHSKCCVTFYLRNVPKHASIPANSFLRKLSHTIIQAQAMPNRLEDFDGGNESIIVSNSFRLNLSVLSKISRTKLFRLKEL